MSAAPELSQLVLTIIGPDRPGLVNALADTIAAGGGNWLEGRMASLGGQFAGLLRVEVPAAQADALAAALGRLEVQGLRSLVAQERGQLPTARAAAPLLELELLGHDRPGIVRDISQVLAAQQVSIVEFESERTSGSFSGEAMFKARAALRLPEGVTRDQVRRSLEALANELMVDLHGDGG